MDRADASVDLLLYDYFKHVTTLALVAIGGVLGIVQGQPGATREGLILVILLLAMGGGVALAAIEAIVKARAGGRPVPSMRWYRLLSGGGLGMGVGAFLAFFLKHVP